MHVRAKLMALGGLLLAMTVVFMMLGGIIESNTLFLLAAASYFVGIMIREAGFRMGAAFYLASVLLGILVVPNKFYVASYAAMGFYILAIEFIWLRMGKASERYQKKGLFWLWKYVVFNLIYLPVLFGFQELLFSRTLSVPFLIGAVAAGEIGLFVYDKAYEYVQRVLWSRMRGRFF
nr:hypothetical protein [uncultured Merdimonas sp.]